VARVKHGIRKHLVCSSEEIWTGITALVSVLHHWFATLLLLVLSVLSNYGLLCSCAVRLRVINKVLCLVIHTTVNKIHKFVISLVIFLVQTRAVEVSCKKTFEPKKVKILVF